MRFNNWQFWVGLFLSVFFLFLLVLTIDVQEITLALSEANYIYAIPAIGLYFIAVYFRSVRWRFLLAPLATVTVTRLYPVVVIGYMANNLMPARLGELVRSYYLARREKISGSAALATIAIERVYDGVTLLAVAAVTAPILLLLGQFNDTSQVYRATVIGLSVAIIIAFLFSLVVLTVATSSWFLQFLSLVLRPIPSAFRPRVHQLAISFIGGLRVLASPRKHLALFLLSLPVWLMEGAMYFLVSYSFGIDGFFSSFWILLLVVLLLTATSNLASALPTSVGGIGPFELAAQQTLVVLGVSASVGAVYAGFLHVVALWLPVNLVGLVLLWKQNLSLRGLATSPTAGAESPARYSEGIASAEGEAP